MNTILNEATLIPFKDYLFKNRRNRTILWVSAIAMIVQFSVFKYFYPFASYIHGDSFVYLETAYKNMSINTYMIGYSMFLRAFSVFTTSDTALVAFQYLLIQGSVLSLLFTLFYFYRPGKGTQMILLCFMVFNPLFLYMGNLVSSDALFLALSLVWVTLLLWIIHQPSLKLIIWHTLVIYFAFTVRYNALIYLFIAAAAFMLSRQSLWMKILNIGACTIAIGLFVLHTGNQYKALTGTWQYSPFAGWQLANNAMYAYRYVDNANRKPVERQFQVLDNMIRKYFDTSRDIKRHPQEALMASTVYMWSPNLTLFKYRNSLFKKDSTASELKKWAYMGPFYKKYGLYIIEKYPGYFSKYFLWPNAMKYYAPPVEFLETYNSGKDSVNTIAQTWFNYKSRRVTTRTKDLRIRLLVFYPILSGIINVVLLFSLLSFSLLGGWRQNTSFTKGILLGGTVWLLNAGFTIFASSAALRFQSFPIILTTIFSGLLVEWIWSMASQPVQKEKEHLSSKIILSV